jgi:hypothetical protein
MYVYLLRPRSSDDNVRQRRLEGIVDSNFLFHRNTPGSDVDYEVEEALEWTYQLHQEREEESRDLFFTSDNYGDDNNSARDKADPNV